MWTGIAEVPVEETQRAQNHPVAKQQRPGEIQHGEELHQPGHRQDGAPVLHAVPQHAAHIQHRNALLCRNSGWDGSRHTLLR